MFVPCYAELVCLFPLSHTSSARCVCLTRARARERESERESETEKIYLEGYIMLGVLVLRHVPMCSFGTCPCDRDCACKSLLITSDCAFRV
jgi:hypothetical protein